MGAFLHSAPNFSFSRPIGAAVTAESAQLSDGLLTELYLAGGLGLVAVLVSVLAISRRGPTRTRVA